MLVVPNLKIDLDDLDVAIDDNRDEWRAIFDHVDANYNGSADDRKTWLAPRLADLRKELKASGRHYSPSSHDKTWLADTIWRSKIEMPVGLSMAEMSAKRSKLLDDLAKQCRNVIEREYFTPK